MGGAVKEDGGDFVDIDYNNYTVFATETVQFKYIAGGKSTLSDVVPVVNVGFDPGEYAFSLNMSKYFVGNFKQATKGNRFDFAI